MQSMKLHKSYPSISKCIYCGDDNSPGKLTLEHIVPEAIGGRLHFKGASCNDCQRKIERFEGRLNNNLFDGVRALLAISSKSSKPRMKTKIGKFDNADGASATLVYTEKQNHPGYLMLETLALPGIQMGPVSLGQNTINTGIAIKNIFWNPTFGSGYTVFTDIVGNHFDFTRLLAKIAHSFWIAERGDCDMLLFLPDFILGLTDHQHNFLVGKNPSLDYPIDDLHFLATGLETKGEVTYGYVDIALFCCFPVYHGYRVYVGALH